jgi:hypothetical protein
MWIGAAGAERAVGRVVLEVGKRDYFTDPGDFESDAAGVAGLLVDDVASGELRRDGGLR